MYKKFLGVAFACAFAFVIFVPTIGMATQNTNLNSAKVETEIGNTGLVLVGDREAIPGEGIVHNDYQIFENENSKTITLNIYTDGWELYGDNKSVDVNFTPSFTKGDLPTKKLILGDVSHNLHLLSFFAYVTMQGVYPSKNTFDLDVNGNCVIEHDCQFTNCNTNISGSGSMTIKDGMFGNLLSTIKQNNFDPEDFKTSINISIDQLNVYNWGDRELDYDSACIIAQGNVDIKRGKVVAISRLKSHKEDDFCSTAIITEDLFDKKNSEINISDQAEVFASGDHYSIISTSFANINFEYLRGSSKTLDYKNADETAILTSTKQISFSNYNPSTLCLAGEEPQADAEIAKTVYFKKGRTEKTIKGEIKDKDGSSLAGQNPYVWAIGETTSNQQLYIGDVEYLSTETSTNYALKLPFDFVGIIVGGADNHQTKIKEPCFGMSNDDFSFLLPKANTFSINYNSEGFKEIQLKAGSYIKISDIELPITQNYTFAKKLPALGLKPDASEETFTLDFQDNGVACYKHIHKDINVEIHFDLEATAAEGYHFDHWDNELYENASNDEEPAMMIKTINPVFAVNVENSGEEIASAQTSDNTNVVALVCLAIISAGAVIALRKKNAIER